MGFKLKPPFNLDFLRKSVFERDMGEDPVYARAQNTTNVILNEDHVKESSPYEVMNTLLHEFKHGEQYLNERKNPGTGLDYGTNGAGEKIMMWKGKELPYSRMEESDPKEEWEAEAYKAEKKLYNKYFKN